MNIKLENLNVSLLQVDLKHVSSLLIVCRGLSQQLTIGEEIRGAGSPRFTWVRDQVTIARLFKSVRCKITAERRTYERKLGLRTLGVAITATGSGGRNAIVFRKHCVHYDTVENAWTAGCSKRIKFSDSSIEFQVLVRSDNIIFIVSVCILDIRGR
jgi:hypothetical protein